MVISPDILKLRDNCRKIKRAILRFLPGSKHSLKAKNCATSNRQRCLTETMTQTIRENGLGPAWKIPGHVHSTISGLAIGVQLVIYLVLASLGTNSHPVLWSLILALDAGITCAICGLCLARSWRARLTAFGLLCINTLLFMGLLLTAFENKLMPTVLKAVIGFI
jgi:hypothetical protein